jgi:Rieske 2Fe-2S family protein
VLTQDGAACEMNQRGLRNPRFAQGTLMPQEFDVHRFQEWVRARRAPASELSGGRP